MLVQLLIGSVILLITIVIEVIFVKIAISRMDSYGKKAVNKSAVAAVFLLSAATIWLLIALSIAIWVWAVTFQWLECFSNLEESLYFSMVAFTTLGFGDLTLPQEWRLLSGLISANGLVLFGLNTAFLIETLRHSMTDSASG